jgi:hypothetical protein
MRLFSAIIVTAILFSLSCGDKSNSTNTQEVSICDTLHCYNGGSCQNGACVCPQGWTGPDCGTRIDPCAAITCKNGGYCINGLCSCPAGYEGPACERIKTPKKIRISQIDVTSFPPTTSTGAGWDLLDGPDIFLVIKKGDLKLFTSTEKYENATTGKTYTFADVSPIDLTDPSSEYSIELYDYDAVSNSDYMCGYSFIPFNGSSFPSKLNIKSSTYGFNVTLSVTYMFN